MKLRDVMRPNVLTVGPDVSADEAGRLMDEGRVHHLPVVRDGRLTGMWLATDLGPVVELGADRIPEMSPDTPVEQAVAALASGDVVVATSDGLPVGILTRRDANALSQGAAGQPIGSRPPLVVRFVGPAGSGKTTLLIRTLARLRRCTVGVIEANPEAPSRRALDGVEGATVEYAPAAHWRKGFREAVERMSGVDVIMVEDRDQEPRADIGLGEDVQIVVVPAADLDTLDMPSLVDAQAVIVTKADQDPMGAWEAWRARLGHANPRLAVFVVGAGDEDPGLREWSQWLEARLLQHRH